MDPRIIQAILGGMGYLQAQPNRMAAMPQFRPMPAGATDRFGSAAPRAAGPQPTVRAMPGGMNRFAPMGMQGGGFFGGARPMPMARPGYTAARMAERPTAGYAGAGTASRTPAYRGNPSYNWRREGQ